MSKRIRYIHMMLTYEDKLQRHYIDTEDESVLVFDSNDFPDVFSWPNEIIVTIEPALKENN